MVAILDINIWFEEMNSLVSFLVTRVESLVRTDQALRSQRQLSPISRRAFPFTFLLTILHPSSKTSHPQAIPPARIDVSTIPAAFPSDLSPYAALGSPCRRLTVSEDGTGRPALL